MTSDTHTTPDGIPVAFLVKSRDGIAALAVPVNRCDQLGEDRPIDHQHHRETRLENLREAPHRHGCTRCEAAMSRRRYSPVVALLDATEDRITRWGRGRLTSYAIATEIVLLILIPIVPVPAWILILTMVILALGTLVTVVATSGPSR
ncbi:hypothetical protein GCM10023196_037550 [Actinoallomurus vinaceus]|uniref:Uncharacterized protein n=1 Tax=Actinoallomurus vinaceus TaxID=1080074 RepID=A0ABP8UC39_9ACTN